jgi:PilZ domain
MEADEELGGEQSKRRSKRSLVLLTAKVKAVGREIDVRLRNLSQTGALLETSVERIPAVNTPVVFERGTTIAAARIAWINGSRFGLEFNDPIEESEVLVHVGPPRRHNEPKASVTFRRTALTNPKLNATEQKIADNWVKRVGPTASGD